MKCLDCKEERGIEFYRSKHRKNGFLPYCKPCYEMRRKKRRNPLVERLRVARWQKKTGYESLKNMRIKYPEKYKARWALQYAVRIGKLDKPKSCDRCLFFGKIEGHHNDYSKPLDVMWLCRKCHVVEHSFIKA